MRITGSYQNIGDLRYFLPFPLPPKDPSFEFNAEIAILYGEANFNLGQLNEMAKRLPDPKRFVKAYVIKEALLSSAIEGIHTTLIDVFEQSFVDAKPNKETQLVLNYTKALDIAISMMENEGLPIVSRVILASHKALMNLDSGGISDPGSYRKQSVRVGNLIPPPATKVPEFIADLEKYIHNQNELPALIKAGLAHVQFETIHPFLDGNGRIGRLLIVLMLIESGLIEAPILYPSYYFKKNHLEYYQCLERVQTHGDFEGWIVFYLKAIRDSAQDAHQRAKEIEILENDLKQMIQNDPKFLKTHKTAIQVLNNLFQNPIFSIGEISQKIKKTYNTVNHIISHFKELGLVSKNTTQKRNKIFRFEPYLKLLEKEY